MNHANKRFIRGLLGAVAGGMFLCAVAYFAGYRINETASLPRGIWRVQKVHKALVHGDLVFFCPPQNHAVDVGRGSDFLRDGTCPGLLEPLFKEVIALCGDHVLVRPGEPIRVNGSAVINSTPLERDGNGRALPRVEYDGVVPEGLVWVLSTYSPLSFDSRYFGPINVGSIEGQAALVWTFDQPLEATDR